MITKHMSMGEILDLDAKIADVLSPIAWIVKTVPEPRARHWRRRQRVTVWI